MFNRNYHHVLYSQKIREWKLLRKKEYLEKYNNPENRKTHPKRKLPPK